MKLVVTHGDRVVEATVEQHPNRWIVSLDGAVYRVDPAGAGALRSLVVEGRQHEVHVDRQGRGRYRVSLAGQRTEVTITDPLTYLAEQAHGGATAGKKTVTAYMPGVVKQVLVEAGQTVARGQGLAVLEAMKMENEIEAEADGVVEKVLVEAGQAVDGGEALFELA